MVASEYITIFYILLPIVAFLYASVGHGGASGYLALMAIFNVAPDQMKPIALVLNIFVSAVALFQFTRQGYFNRQLFLWLSALSFPLAFLGGKMKLENDLYKLILGAFLIFAILKLSGIFDKKSEQELEIKKPNLYLALVLGSSIGFLSGLIGIGGGIILTPLLLFLKWSTIKDAAGISAAFILVTSTAGLFGHATNGIEMNSEIYLFILLVVSGGFLGSYFGSTKFKAPFLRYLLAVVLIVACVKLLVS